MQTGRMKYDETRSIYHVIVVVCFPLFLSLVVTINAVSRVAFVNIMHTDIRAIVDIVLARWLAARLAARKLSYGCYW